MTAQELIAHLSEMRPDAEVRVGLYCAEGDEDDGSLVDYECYPGCGEAVAINAFRGGTIEVIATKD